mgnify:CR=1 FL=1
MAYPRLRLARNLLSDDGVIFISIDDNELENLKKICNEVFGEENFVACVIWERAFAPVNLKKHFSECHDYVLCYAKQLDNLVCNGLPRDDVSNERYQNPDNDPRGPWATSDFSVGPVVPEKVYEITTPSGRKVWPPHGRCWLLTKERFVEFLTDNRIWFGEDGNGVPRIKRFLSEVKQGITPMTIWKHTEVGHSQDAKQRLKDLFDGKAIFDYPKSVGLIRRMLELYSTKDCLILDFFAGSATTAHAVMQLNAEDGGNRKFIMVQLPEPTAEKGEAYKAGYKTVSDIGKERIRRAGEKIKSELISKQKGKLDMDGDYIEPDNLDIGFKIFKLDSSNIKKWNPDYDDIEKSLFSHIDNFVEGRTELDIVYEIMLKMGLDLSYSVDEYQVAGKKVYSIGLGALLICLDNEITIDVAKGMLELKKELNPEFMRVVFKDNGFKDDSSKTNVKEILKNGGINEFITL